MKVLETINSIYLAGSICLPETVKGAAVEKSWKACRNYSPPDLLFHFSGEKIGINLGSLVNFMNYFTLSKEVVINEAEKFLLFNLSSALFEKLISLGFNEWAAGLIIGELMIIQRTMLLKASYIKAGINRLTVETDDLGFDTFFCFEVEILDKK